MRRYVILSGLLLFASSSAAQLLDDTVPEKTVYEVPAIIAFEEGFNTGRYSMSAKTFNLLAFTKQGGTPLFEVDNKKYYLKVCSTSQGQFLKLPGDIKKLEQSSNISTGFQTRYHRAQAMAVQSTGAWDYDAEVAYFSALVKYTAIRDVALHGNVAVSESDFDSLISIKLDNAVDGVDPPFGHVISLPIVIALHSPRFRKRVSVGSGGVRLSDRFNGRVAPSKIGPNSISMEILDTATGNTLPHELGHYFGLFHTWGRYVYLDSGRVALTANGPSLDQFEDCGAINRMSGNDRDVWKGPWIVKSGDDTEIRDLDYLHHKVAAGTQVDDTFPTFNIYPRHRNQSNTTLRSGKSGNYEQTACYAYYNAKMPNSVPSTGRPYINNVMSYEREPDSTPRYFTLAQRRVMADVIEEALDKYGEIIDPGFCSN